MVVNPRLVDIDDAKMDKAECMSSETEVCMAFPKSITDVVQKSKRMHAV